jgi:hypothetical protein
MVEVVGERAEKNAYAFLFSKRPLSARAATDSTSTAVKCEVMKNSDVPEKIASNGRCTTSFRSIGHSAAL